ncbi:MAG: transcription antitermination factor NusB [Phycisphaerae bacterium]
MMEKQSPREIAVAALGDRAGNVTAHLERLLADASLEPADSGFARELALGAVRRRATLETVLRAYLAQPDRRLPGPLEGILAVAVYQLLFLARVPAFAAVNEAVGQVMRRGLKGYAGMANGVLRTISRGLSDIQTGRPPIRVDVVPIGPNSYRMLDRAVFPDAAQTPTDYIAAAYSLPAALATRWLTRFGSLDAAIDVAMHANARAPQILRVNMLKADVAGSIAALASEGLAAVPHANGMSIVLTEHQNVAALRALRDGLVQPQDPTATSVGIACGVRPGMSVLDFCAAPGTKTTHLAELMANSGSITAVDVSQERLQRVTDNCSRLGVSIVTTCLAEEVAQRLKPGSFDVVLADVPCSNTGVLARRAEARWQFSEDSLAAIVKDQRFLAAAAASFVKPGGRLVYSTCSIEPEENSELAMGLVRKVRGLRLIEEKLTLPGGAEYLPNWRDGGYHAVFTR